MRLPYEIFIRVVTMTAFYSELSLGAQASYAELYDMVKGIEATRLGTLRGSFHRRRIKGKTYIYFNFRDIEARVRSVYVGPESQRVQQLIESFKAQQTPERDEAINQRSLACAALGCCAESNKSTKAIRKVSSYGVFRNGGILIGSHAFSALGNVLGVRWTTRKAQYVDTAPGGDCISIALPREWETPTLDAITALEMGQLPIGNISGRTSAERADLPDAKPRIEFVSNASGRGRVVQPPIPGTIVSRLKFLDFSLQGTIEGVLFGPAGACLVNLPDPARFAIQQLIFSGARSTAERTKSLEALEQAAALVTWHLDQGRTSHFQGAWRDAQDQGPARRRRAEDGRDAMVKLHPNLAAAFGSPPI